VLTSAVKVFTSARELAVALASTRVSHDLRHGVEHRRPAAAVVVAQVVPIEERIQDRGGQRRPEAAWHSGFNKTHRAS
jgi:hypothetical protein